MRIAVRIDGDLQDIMRQETLSGERAVTRGVDAAGRDLQKALRGQIQGAGLGKRLANTIRHQLYPTHEDSLGAASLVWSKAPHIVGAYDEGALIRSKDGFYLAIPLPAAGRRGPRRKRITPGGWEQRNGMRLRFVYRRTGPSVLVADDARISKSGRATQKRGRRRKDGILTGAQTIPIFVLVPQVKLRKRLDINRVAQSAMGRLPSLILKNWPGGRR